MDIKPTKPQPQQTEPGQSSRFDRAYFSFRVPKFALGIIIGLLVPTAVLAFILLMPHKTADFLPQRLHNTVTFPLYYPAELPAGFTPDESTFTASNKAVVYGVKKSNDKKIIFTVQPTPENFDFNNFNRQRLLGSKEIITRSGKAVVGLYDDHLLGSLVIDKTWVIINASPGVSDKDMETVTESITQSISK